MWYIPLLEGIGELLEVLIVVADAVLANNTVLCWGRRGI